MRLAAAAALGGAIGLERELREREAGFRTHMLVSVGAALFTLVSAYAWGDFAFSQASGVTFDPTRIAAQIVTGIGFIGAGAIIRQGLSVRGLTTAATLWMVAAIGMACGAGFYWAAVIADGDRARRSRPTALACRGGSARGRIVGSSRWSSRQRRSAAPVLLGARAARSHRHVVLDHVSRGRASDGLRHRAPERRGRPRRSCSGSVRLEEVSGVKWIRQ